MRKRRGKKPRPVVFPLKEILARYGLSQSELARRTGMGQNRVNAIANGRCLPNWSTILRLSTAMGADLGDLQPGKDGAA